MLNERATKAIAVSDPNNTHGHMRVAVLNSHPIQYFAPLYAYLNRTESLQLTALYLSDFSVRGSKDRGFGVNVKWDIDLLTGYPYQFIGRRAVKRELGGFASIVAPEIWSVIRRAKYDALVVHGYAIAANLVAIAAARSVNTPVLMRCESHGQLLRQGTRAKSVIVRKIFGQCDAFLAIGSANADYYRSLGIEDKRIFLMPYSIDNERFAAESILAPGERKARRAAMGVNDDRPVVLFAGKFLSRKHPDKLIEAARQLTNEGVQFHLAMIGAGEMRPALDALVNKYELDNVSFHGFVNQADLPKVYSSCDLFVLASENEPWGLAVNEAMACGLPVIATSEIGSAMDLVEGYRVGATVPNPNPEELACAMRPILLDSALRKVLACNARNRIAEWGYKQAASGLVDALNYVQAGRLSA